MQEFGGTYRAMPSMTSFMARYFPSVGTPFLMVGRAASFLPSLSIRFHRTAVYMSVKCCGFHSELRYLTLVEHGGPNGSDGVDGGHAVGVGVGVGVGGKAGGVRVCADAGRRVVDPSTHGVVLLASVARLQADGCSHEVTPALTHAAGLESVQAVGVGWTAGKTSGKTVAC